MRESFKNIVNFWKITVRQSKSFVLLLCMNIFVSALTPFPAIILSKRLFDSLSAGDSIHGFLIPALLLVGISFLLKFISNYINNKVEIKGQQMMYSLNTSYNLKSTNISFELLSNPQILEKKELASKAVSGSNFIDMVRSVNSIVSSILTLFGVVALFVQLDFIILLVVIVVILINTYANNLVKKVQYKNSIEVTPYLRKIEYIRSVTSDLEYGKEIRINGFKPILLNKVKDLNRICFSYIKKTQNVFSRGRQTSTITDAIQDLIVYSILGFKVIVDKTMSIGDFSMYFSAIGQFKNSLVTIISTLTDIKINSLYFGHYLEYMNLPEENNEENNKTSFTDGILNIRFDNVSFIYPGADTYALKNVSFSINSNEKLSIVGTNGSGKTTIVKLLLRLYKPTEGKIFINDVDINDIKFSEYAKQFSVVFQDFKLFAFNIAENVSSEENPDYSKIESSLSKVDLLSKVESLPRKYETNYSRRFDDEGVEFSGGESQKLAISRALYKDSQIVIMDEPTSALDPLAEYEIYKDFNKLIAGKTAIYISHRLSSCRFCDRIILIDLGEIKESGSHDELIHQNGIYAEMYNKQAQYYVDNNMGDS